MSVFMVLKAGPIVAFGVQMVAGVPAACFAGTAWCELVAGFFLAQLLTQLQILPCLTTEEGGWL